jgi:hypothetical protein
MTSFDRAVLATLGFALLVVAGPAWGSPVEKLASAPPPLAEEGLRRCGYRPPQGAQLVGEPTAGPTGDELAFFEQGAAGYELVVCIKGADPARWPIDARLAKLKIFWIARSEIVLGQHLLAPRARVRWQVARSAS